LDRFNGDTPANYFSRFKKVIKAATKQGYFRINPAEDLAAKGNRNKARKDHLESAEYIRLLETPCLNNEVKHIDLRTNPKLLANYQSRKYLLIA